MMIEAIKQRLIDAGLVLAHQGHGDMTRGHVSVRVPGESELFFMKPHSIGLDEITMENILTINLAGEVVAGAARRHSEVYIHSEVYRARPDVRAVIHTRSTCSVVLSCTGRPIRPISQGGAAFAGALPLFTGTIDLIRSAEMGRAAAEALGPHSAVLLMMLETAAHIQLMVEAAGETAPEFPPEEVTKLRRNLMEERQFPVNFEYLVRRAKRR